MHAAICFIKINIALPASPKIFALTSIAVVEDDLELMKNYLGARGVGIKIMLDEIDPKIDDFELQNRFINYLQSLIVSIMNR